MCTLAKRRLSLVRKTDPSMTLGTGSDSVSSSRFQRAAVSNGVLMVWRFPQIRCRSGPQPHRPKTP